MTYPEWKFWIDVGQYALNLCILVYVAITNRQKVTNARFKSLEDDVATRAKSAEVKKIEDRVTADVKKIEDRVTRIEADVHHLPSHADMQKLSDKIQELHGDLHELSGSLKGINRAVDLINEHLINRRI